MMPNNKPWKAIVNTNAAVLPLLSTNNLSAVKKTATKSGQLAQTKVVAPRRYSFDDNGGGYLGL